jgi:hypothetical protein
MTAYVSHACTWVLRWLRDLHHVFHDHRNDRHAGHLLSPPTSHTQLGELFVARSDLWYVLIERSQRVIRGVVPVDNMLQARNGNDKITQ